MSKNVKELRKPFTDGLISLFLVIVSKKGGDEVIKFSLSLRVVLMIKGNPSMVTLICFLLYLFPRRLENWPLWVSSQLRILPLSWIMVQEKTINKNSRDSTSKVILILEWFRFNSLVVDNVRSILLLQVLPWINQRLPCTCSEALAFSLTWWTLSQRDSWGLSSAGW